MQLWCWQEVRDRGVTELQEKGGEGRDGVSGNSRGKVRGDSGTGKNMGLGMQKHPRHFPDPLQQPPHQSCLSRTAKKGLLEAKPAQVSIAQR